MRDHIISALGKNERISLRVVINRLSTVYLLSLLTNAQAHSTAVDLAANLNTAQSSLAVSSSSGRSLQQATTLSYSRGQRASPYDEDLSWQPDRGLAWPQSGSHGRKLQASPAASPWAAPPSAHGIQGQLSKSTVYTIQNNNDAGFGVYVCIDSCAHGNTCVWGNAWLWMCNGTNPTHHYWVWEPDTLIIRSATTDSFWDYPHICLEMCTDARYGNGPCAMTSQLGTLNVAYAQCTGASNQQFTLNGTQIISVNNSQCVSAGAQPCGRWADCNKSQAQTRQDGYILNVFMEDCDTDNLSQQWTLGDAPNSTLIPFTPLNESASEFPPTVDNLATLLKANSEEVVNFVSEEDPNLCLSIENQASCQSSQLAGTGTIINPLSQVCVWNNALLTTCWPGGSDQAADQGWIYDNTTKLIALAANEASHNACLELCSSTSFAHGSCSLVADNLVLRPCSGGPAQQFDFIEGVLYNKMADLCIGTDPICMADYSIFLSYTSAADSFVDDFRLGDCLTQVKNGPWSALPWTPTNRGPLGFRNLVGVPCDGSGVANATVFVTTTSKAVNTTDPVAPGIVSTGPAQSGSGTNVGAIAVGCGGSRCVPLGGRKS